jgi:DNA polymerase
MKHELFLDIETYSSVDLKRLGVYPYAASPDFKMLMCAYGMDDDPIKVVTSLSDIVSIDGLWDPDVIKVAHNAQFERVCFTHVGRDILEVEPDEYLDPADWHDTAAVAAVRGLPRKLEYLATVLGGEQKDTAGTALINMFCVPRREFNYERAFLPEEKPQEWEQFIEYCGQDVETHRDAHRRMGGWPVERERQVFIADQRINDRGIKLDVELAQAAKESKEENDVIAGKEMMDLTGANTPGSLAHIKEWLASKGSTLPDMKAETLEAELKKPGRDPQARRVIVLRQELGLIATKKYEVALDSMNADGRVRGQFRYHGAHTGRWSGRGIQVHNLPRHWFKSKMEDDDEARLDSIVQTMAARLDLVMGFGASTDTLKKMVRSMLVGPFTIVDYSAIEARVLAWLAGEQWILDSFMRGEDIYVVQAKKMSTPTKKMERRDGKIAILALGYQGAIGSLQAMGAEGGKEELLPLVRAYRDSVPEIVSYWYEVERAFRIGGSPGAGFVTIEKDGNDRLIHLPSGRTMEYHNYKMITVRDKHGREKTVPSFVDYQKGKTGVRVPTYGGRLTENITQAVARDVLADALVNLENEGYKPVLHIHDEAVTEGEHLEEVKEIMDRVPDWAPGLPIKGEGFTAPFYVKG